MAIELHSRAAAPAAEDHKSHAGKKGQLERVIKRTDINVNQIVREGGTGREYRRGTDVSGEQRSEKVQIDETIDQDYRRALENHISILQHDVHPDTLTSDPRFAKDKHLLDMLSDGKGGVDSKKLNDFLHSDKGWALATSIVEDQATVRRMALGAVVSALPPGERDALMREGFTDLTEGRGRFYQFFDKLQPFENRSKIFGMGKQIRWNQDPDVFRAVMGDPTTTPPLPKDTNMIRYIKEVTRIDLDDYHLVGDKIQPKSATPPVSGGPARAAESGVAAKKIQSELKQLAIARKNFLVNGCGIDEKTIDGAFDQWLQQGHRELIGTHINEAVYQEFLNLGGLYDTADKPQRNALFRVGVGGHGTRDLWDEKNIRLWYEAHSKVLGRMMEEYAEEINTSGTEVSTRITALTDLKRSITGEGDIIGEVRKKIGNEKTNIDADVTHLTSHKDRFDAIPTKQQVLEDAQEQLEMTLIKRFDPILWGGSRHDASIALQKIREVLTDKTGTASIRIYGENDDKHKHLIDIAGIAHQRTQLTNEKNARIATLLSGKTPKEVAKEHSLVVDQVEKEFANQEAGIDRQEKLLQNLIEAVENQQGTITQKTQELSQENNTDTITAIQQMADSYKEVSSWSVKIPRKKKPLEITQADLQTTPIDDLIKRANEIYENGGKNLRPPIGWSENQNSDPANRQKLLNAIAEAKAYKIHPPEMDGSAGNFAEFTKLTDPTTWGISEYELLTLSEDQLKILMNAKRTRNPALATTHAVPDTLVPTIQEIAKKRFDARRTAVNNEIVDKKAQSLELHDRMSAVKFDKLQETVDSALVVANRQEPIFKMRDQLFRDSTKYFNASDIASSKEVLTDEERNLGALPVGYLELLDVFFDYKAKGSKREAEYKKAAALIPPRKMAELLNTHLLGDSIKPGANFEKDVFLEIQKRTKARRGTPGAITIDGFDMRRGLQNIINRVLDETIITKP